MRTLVLTLAAALIVIPTGCGYFSSGTPGKKQVEPLLKDKVARKKSDSPATPEQDAILRVLEEMKGQFKARFEKLESDSQPSVMSKFSIEFAEAIEKTDLTGCPAEFQAVMGRYARSWRGLQGSLVRLPDAYTDTDFMDAIQALFRADPTRGRVLGGDVIAAIKKINSTYAEVYAAASGYGIEVE